MNGLPMRQSVRFAGERVVSSWSSRQAAVRGSLSVGSIVPEMGARWWLWIRPYSIAAAKQSYLGFGQLLV